MTSTVLDVTVLLLCVSASVVALGAADGDRGAAGPEAAEVADLIATETVTVTYASAEAPNGTRTVHATRAELLALVAAGGEGDGEGHAARDAFDSQALSAIERGIGPRTRIDVEVETEAADDSSDGTGSESEAQLPNASVGSSRRASNGSSLSIGPKGWRFGSDGTDREPASATGTGVPWRVDREDGDSGGPESRSPAAESESPEPITVGSDPPRDVDVTAAVITQPVPTGSGSTGTVRIVIRRW